MYTITQIGWTSGVTADGFSQSLSKKVRPCFYLSNAFSQAFGMGDRARNLLCHRAHSDVISPENFSFNTAATRFSNGLTRDDVFTGIRAIIQAIGELSSNHMVRIDFSVGTLFLGRERNQFVFNKRLRALIQPGTHEIDTYTEVSSVSRLSSSSRRGEVYPDESVSVISSSRSRPRQHPALPEPTIKTRSLSAEPSHHPISGNRQQFAYKAALARHMSDLEHRATEAVDARKQWEEHLRSSVMLSELEAERRRKVERENAQFLLKQMSESSSRKKTERNDEIQTTNRLAGFPRFTEPAESELKLHLRQSGENIRKELDCQVHAGKSLRSAAYAHDKEIALKLNESSRRDLDELVRVEEAKKKQERNVLCESWNRDIQIKNCMRRIEQYDMIPEKLRSSNVGVLLPNLTGDDETRSQILGGSSRRSLTGSVRRR